MIKDFIKNNLKNYPRLFNFVKDVYQAGKVFKRMCFNGDFNYFNCFVSAKLRLKKSLGKPLHLTLEPTNICNLKCPVCETGIGYLNRISKIMKFEKFKYILDQFDGNLKILYLYFMGEPLLNKDIYRMIRYAVESGLYVSICTNGEFIEPEELIKSGIAEVQFQIGGITQETHNIYRKGGDLKRTLDNLKATINIKKKYQDEIKEKKYLLKIILGLILMKNNENQLEGFIKLAKEIGVDEFQIISPCVRNIEQAREFLPQNKNYWIYDEQSFRNGKLKMKYPPHNYCEWIYSTVTIQVDGSVVPCCRDAKGQYILGNVFKENIYSIWNNEKFNEIRKKIALNQENFVLCKLCEGYRIPDIP